jgi:hypothetical protein
LHYIVDHLIHDPCQTHTWMNVIVQNLAPFPFIPCVDIVALLACVVNCLFPSQSLWNKEGVIDTRRCAWQRKKVQHKEVWGHASLMKFNDVLVSKLFAFEGCCVDGK